MKNNVFIAVGSNIGDRFEYISKAVKQIDSHGKINVVNTSSIYETEPIGYTDQDRFLNMVLQVETELGPYELLEELLMIEDLLGRKRGKVWGPRTLDLDILLYNQENIKSEKLTIPHPRMQERAFVMIPLGELELGSKLASAIASLPDKEGVRIWKQKNGEDVFALFEN
ncbi:2-amino-4-hydroxy-6-hydroxymethyldihydropteridine diphosphokinase [Bacillus sp. B15-48]|uniref:2-amino-4-hydroxy-6- hydroxymethyldihydropteridine diphosphokinase n=1 Tax=Bacillus sp. B15-48 TaxID=1548601 RepID=UPI00193FE843|nr:2-amino-4-hydroxy-6-hydroxymethyldihydropteridine diphosphokinase [Bacillus sp. B15-48]MBM4765288.1 2-amino-4-hydroxy-6-hydroxymethyldihydropteridine diphosphokinase [Bacillus sp. B15-48]